MSAPRNLAQRLFDEMEGPLLRACLSDGQSREARHAYAAWLETQSAETGARDAAQLLRAEVGDERLDEPRLAELLATVDREWWTIAQLGPAVRGCPASEETELSMRFRFLCPRTWELLEPGDDPGVRYCTGCGENVYLATHEGEARDLARSGRCLAIARSVETAAQRRLTRMMVGRPDVNALWANEIFRD